MGQAFTEKLDIINRALQHCELPRIASLDEMSPNAQECLFAYDKIRRRELRRNLWRFATRRAAIRPIASTSVLLQPALYDATVTYAGGTIVRDSDANLWINVTAFNTGNTPDVQGSGWEPYFGPMTVTPWNQPSPPQNLDANPYAVATGVQFGSSNGTTAYYPGEIVYLPDGKGGITLFQATRNSPATRRPEGPYQVGGWRAGVTYSMGQIALIYTDSNGNLVLGVPEGLGVEGLTSTAYQSTIDFNTGNQADICETSASVPWSAATTYSIDNVVTGSDTQLYQAVQGTNLNHDPVTDTLYVWWEPLNMFSGTWTTAISPIPRAASNQWQYIPGTAATMVIPYPLTAGPLENNYTRNAYRLPAGYLREAPADPQQGGTTWLGAPAYNTFQQDWTYEGNFIVTANAQPLVYRFVADVTDVTAMDDMFCEGFAAELAMAVQPILQPGRPDLKMSIKASYKETVFEARTVNAIEIGGVKPPSDDYLNCRL